MEVGLSLGGNKGDRLRALKRARASIVALPDTDLAAASPVYETEPVGVKPEHRDKPFLNAVLIVTSELPPEELSDRLHGIERRLGRTRQEDRYAPRTIDIDVIYMGRQVRIEPRLTIPHPRCLQRRFVMQPLADVRPDMRLPGHEQTVREALLALPQSPKVVLFAREWQP